MAMNLYGYEILREDDLMHHGIKGQKWGVRRYQNEDGTWTAAGKARYGDDNAGQARSFGGNIHRALAKAYGVNEKYYSKRSNTFRGAMMANANKAAKEAQLKKAEEADKKRVDKNISKFEKKLGKFESKVDKFNSDTLSGREKQLAKLEKKGSTNEKLADFKEGTKYVKAGQDRVKDVIGNYKSAKVAAIKDSSYKKSLEYKQAVARFNEVSGNLPMATLGYAMKEAGNRHEK